MFVAYLLAPAVDIVSRTIRFGPRRRPVSRGAALALIYAVLSIPIGLAWRFGSAPIAPGVAGPAPAAVDDLFDSGNFETIDRFVSTAPVPAAARPMLTCGRVGVVGYIEHQAHTTLDTLID